MTSDVLDGCIQYFLREVVCADITADCKCITASSLNFVNNNLCLLLVQTIRMESRDRTHAHGRQPLGENKARFSGEQRTHSVTMTFAPSFANKRAALRPIPY